MIRIHSIGGLFVLVTAATVLTGCAGTGTEQPAPGGTPYPSQVSQTPTEPVAPRDSPIPTNLADLPTIGATAPPNGPTDALKKTDIVVGTVTRGGSGPCYGVQTDDGTQYALYSAKGQNLVRGTRVKARTKPSRLRIDCGAGRFLEATTLELMR